MELRIKYDSMDRQYIVQTKDGEFKFKKYEIGLPYIDALKTQDVAYVQTVWENFECFTKKKSPRLKSLAKPREWLAIHLRDNLN